MSTLSGKWRSPLLGEVLGSVSASWHTVSWDAVLPSWSLSWLAVVALVELQEKVVDGAGQVVHLALELLHILVHSISLVGVCAIALRELLLESLLSLLDLLVHSLDDHVHLLALSDLTQDVPLELQHGLANDLVVEVDHVRADLLLELLV